MPVLKTDHLILTLTSENKTNTSALETLRNQSILLLRKQDREKHFTDCDWASKLIFILTNHTKEPDSKPKQRIVGEIKVESGPYELDWQIMDLSIQQNFKNSFKYFCEVKWLKSLEVSKSKLPEPFQSVFGRKDGFHLLQSLKGLKLKDLLEYPPSMYETIFKQLDNKQYVKNAQSEGSSQSSSSDSSSDTSESESDSEDSEDSSDNKRRKKKKRSSRSRDKKKSTKERKKSQSRGKKRKDQKKKKEKTKRNKSRDKSKDRKKEKEKKRKSKDRERQKEKEKEKEKNRDKDRDRDRDRDRNRQREKQKQKQKQKQRNRDKSKERQKKGKEQKDKARNTDRERNREKERQGHRSKLKQKQREKERDRQRENQKNKQRQKTKEKEKIVELNGNNKNEEKVIKKKEQNGAVSNQILNEEIRNSVSGNPEKQCESTQVERTQQKQIILPKQNSQLEQSEKSQQKQQLYPIKRSKPIGQTLQSPQPEKRIKKNQNQIEPQQSDPSKGLSIVEVPRKKKNLLERLQAENLDPSNN